MPVSLMLDLADPLEATTAFLAILTWPEHPSDDHRSHAHAALMAHIYRGAAGADPNWEWKTQTLKPGYLLLDPKSVARRMVQTVARLQDVLKVARIARPFIAREELSKPPPLPRDVPRRSLNAVIPYALGDEDVTDTHNFEQRIVRRTLPMLHLERFHPDWKRQTALALCFIA